MAAKLNLPSTRANLRIPIALKDELKKLAKRRKVSLNKISERALFSYVKRSA